MNFVALLKEMSREMATNKASPSSDQNLSHG
jgi:hypothetical protein